MALVGQRSLRTLTDPSEVAAALLDLYRENGSALYDEVVTQTEHALQCGSAALEAGASHSMVVAAFLHDVGHLLEDDGEGSSGSRGRDLRHEHVGARLLANWFDADVVEPVRLHVAAKRYLCAIDPSYRNGLSPASVQSLGLQGGPMTRSEQREFRVLAHGDAAVELRRWDDVAKSIGAAARPLERFGELLVEILSQD